MDMISVLEKALERTGTLVASVTDDQLKNTTPCKDFDCRALVNHIVGGNHYIASIMNGTPMAGGEPPDFVADGATSAFEQSKKVLLEAFRSASKDGKFAFPFAELGYESAMGIGLLETTVHGWDLAKATGQDDTIDPMLATMLMQGAQQMPDALRNDKGDPFGKSVPVPDDAPPHHKLVALLGRTP